MPIATPAVGSLVTVAMSRPNGGMSEPRREKEKRMTEWLRLMMADRERAGARGRGRSPRGVRRSVVAGVIPFALAAGSIGLAAQEDPGEMFAGFEPYEVGQAAPPLEPGGTPRPLRLEEAIGLALENNLGIRRERLNPEIQRSALRAARSAFGPTLSASLGHNSATTQSTSQLDGGTLINTERNTLAMTFNQPLRWWGADMSATFNSSRTATDNVFATRNPSYSSVASLSLRQPLLAGRRIDDRRGAVRAQEIRGDVTDALLRAHTEQLAAQVRGGYWTLLATIEQIEIQRRSLALAEELLEHNRIGLELGLLVEIDLAQAEVQVANAEQALLNAEIEWRNQEMAFKRLLVSGSGDPLFGETLIPTDLPSFEEVEVDIEGAVASAMRIRPELEALRRQQEITEMDVAMTRDGRRPNLDLVLSYSLQGIGGDLFERQELGGEPRLIQPGGYRDGLASIATFDTPTLNAALNFSVPIGANAGDARLEQARLQQRQAELELQAQELMVETEVTTAGLAVRNAYLQLEAARRTREAAERSAEAEMMRLEVGVSTNFQVVTVQNALTAARLSELQATIAYALAIAEFDRVQGRGL
jgi:outer membrane protein